jgi:flagellin-like protein
MFTEKKGLSPIIATVLLIMLAIILAIIVLIWARSFIGENVTKNLGGGDEPIETFCEQVDFVIDILDNSDTIDVTAQNNGNVPIYGFEIRKKTTFSVKKIADVSFNDVTLLSGETKDSNSIPADVDIDDSVLVVPVLLGQADSGKKYYTCDDKFGIETTVK